MSNYALLSAALRLYPKEQIPALKWMHDYLLDTERYTDERSFLFTPYAGIPIILRPKIPKKQAGILFLTNLTEPLLGETNSKTKTILS